MMASYGTVLQCYKAAGVKAVIDAQEFNTNTSSIGTKRLSPPRLWQPAFTMHRTLALRAGGGGGQ